MSDAKDLISEIVDAVQEVREFVKHPNARTSAVYVKSMDAIAQAGSLGAAAVVSGILAAGSPVISIEQPVRKPEEHIASQSRASETIMEASNTLEDTLVSVVQVSTWDELQMRVDEQAQVMRETSEQREEDSV